MYRRFYFSLLELFLLWDLWLFFLVKNGGVNLFWARQFPGPLFQALEYVGDPVSAESRESYRASVISADMAAEVGEERDLSVQDVSATGFAVVSANEYPIGTVLEVAINYEGDFYSGTASVQSIREFSSKRIRYGMRALEGSDLPDGLHQICMAVQRLQLERKGGAS